MAFAQGNIYAIFNKTGEENSFITLNAFAILNFCYQIGTFISRSSLHCYKVERIWLLTLLQFFNFIFWLLNSFYLICDSLVFMAIQMIFVGLMGGSSYVNVLYQIRTHPSLDAKEKELAMLISTCFNDMGVFLASLTSLAFTSTVYAKVSNS